MVHKRICLCVLGLMPAILSAETGGFSLETIDQEIDKWDIFGSTTYQGEYYSNRGDIDASIFPFDGDQGFIDYSINFNKRVSPFDNWRGQVFGAINGSEYRSTENGLIIERASLVHEKGDGAIPYRWELGDYFGFFSFRTVQRALKGGQIELQPNWGGSNQRHSIVLFTGSDDALWTEYDPKDNYFSGASWLVDDIRYGRYSLNFVHNVRDKENNLENDRNQYLTSVAGEKLFDVYGQKITVETELAYFEERQDSNNGNEEQDSSDKAVYLQLSGRSSIPLTYRFRIERYGENYRPSGAVITSNRLSIEGHAAWRFDSGFTVRARALKFKDALEGDNPIDTRTYGLNATGQFFPSLVENLAGRLDAFAQRTHDENDTLDRWTYTVVLDLNKQLPFEINGRLGVFWQYIDDDVNQFLHTKQVSINADRAIDLFGFQGSISPGIVIRELDGLIDGTEISPTFAAFLSHDRHRLGMNLSYDDFDRLDKDPLNDGEDLNNYRASFDYRYSVDQHTFGIEMEHFHRDPHSGENTNTYKIAGFWRYDFDRPASQSAAKKLAIEAITVEDVITSPAQIDIVNYAPGTEIAVVRSQLDKVLGQPNNIAGILVYEGSLFGDFDQRQRVAISHEAGLVTNAAIIIDFDNVGNLDDVQQTFERFREKMIRRYGQPTSTFERGDFGNDPALLVNALDNNEFVRNTQWQTEKGILRLGIPSRLNGTLRMELQHARSLPPMNDSAWSLEAIL